MLHSTTGGFAMTSPIIEEVVAHLETLPPDLQKQVLSFVRTLDASSRQGTAGERLMPFVGTIPTADLDAMSKAIEEGCEQINLNDW
jgi:hypothetical protein